MKKRVLTLITIVALVVAAFPIVALAEEYETSIVFTYTPVTRENIETVIEEGNDVSNDGVIKGWAFFKDGELKYFYDGMGWADSDYRNISKPKNFDDINQVLEKIEFKKDGVLYNAKGFTGVTANDVALELTTIPYFPKKAATGYCFINPTNDITDQIDVYLLTDLEAEDTMSVDNPKTADQNSALPYGCAALAALVCIGFSIRWARRERNK